VASGLEKIEMELIAKIPGMPATVRFGSAITRSA
jgi:hypothetical protein